MLESPNKFGTSGLIPFVPRQVIMLDSKSKKMSRKDTLEMDSIDPKTLTRNSIAGFLERDGLVKTLAVLRSEAQIDSDLKASSINLEDLVCKFLESRSHEEAAINGPKEKGSKQANTSAKDVVEHIHDTLDHTHKKKREHRKEPDDGINPIAEHGLDKNSLGYPKDLETLKSAENSSGEIKEKKKKKKSLKENADKNNPEVDSGTAKNSADDKLPNTGVDDKAKKKKHKVLSDACDVNPGSRDHPKLQEILEEKITELNSLNNVPSTIPSESNSKQKGEKKKKKNTEAISIENENEHSESKQKGKKKKKKNTEAISIENENEHTKKALEESERVLKKSTMSGNDDTTEKKERTETTANENESEDTKKALEKSENVVKKSAASGNDDMAAKKARKKRKRLESEERVSQSENGSVAKEYIQVRMEGTEDNKESESSEKSVKPIPDGDNTTAGKKRKTAENRLSLKRTFNASPQAQEPSAEDTQKKSGACQLAIGRLEKDEKEVETTSNFGKKDKRSVEPKTVDAFQRVKIDEVKFADERLQDNSYWALDSSGSGYGAKAQEVLGQVKGRDFRHEKTKKKRGSYRGGQIDLQSHSIKFNYSDEE